MHMTAFFHIEPPRIPARYLTERAMMRMLTTQNTLQTVMSSFTSSTTKGSVTILDDHSVYIMCRKSKNSSTLPISKV